MLIHVELTCKAERQTYKDMKTKPIRILLFVCLLFCSLYASAQNDRLFHVSRNLNRNVICYDVQTKNGALDTSAPLHVYWYNYESDPHTTNELTFIQRTMAYGYSVVSASATEATVKLKAYNKRTLHVCRQGGKWVGVVKINGKDCILTEIFAHCPSRTSCDYMELRGKRLSDGTVEKETVK